VEKAERGPTASVARSHGQHAERRSLRVPPESAEADEIPAGTVSGHEIARGVEVVSGHLIVEPGPIASPTRDSGDVLSELDVEGEEMIRPDLIGGDRLDAVGPLARRPPQGRPERHVEGERVQLGNEARSFGQPESVVLTVGDGEMDRLVQFIDRRVEEGTERGLGSESVAHEEAVVRSQERRRQANGCLAVDGEPSPERLQRAIPLDQLVAPDIEQRANELSTRIRSDLYPHRA